MEMLAEVLVIILPGYKYVLIQHIVYLKVLYYVIYNVIYILVLYSVMLYAKEVEKMTLDVSVESRELSGFWQDRNGFCFGHFDFKLTVP